MSNKLNTVIELTEDGWTNEFDVGNDLRHQVQTDVSVSHGYAEISFTSRAALYDFARSLLHEAVYGSAGRAEYLPEYVDLKNDEWVQACVNGVRMSKDSARLFISYPDKDEFLLLPPRSTT